MEEYLENMEAKERSIFLIKRLENTIDWLESVSYSVMQAGAYPLEDCEQPLRFDDALGLLTKRLGNIHAKSCHYFRPAHEIIGLAMW